MDVQDDGDFLEINNLVELSQKMMKKNRHNVYLLVYKLMKLCLLLPVATASVERVFSSMNLMKNRHKK
jgi:hAT family C-terminal dimerisation region